MFHLTRPIVVVCACLVTAFTLEFAVASPASALGVGDPAPPLVQGDYVQGEPIEKMEAGQIYVVEFWATWCGPCVDAIPHVNALQRQYADNGVVMIGQNVWEDDTSAVKPFIEKMGDDMTYRVAFDEDGKMAETWMEAAEQNGIPAAFIVDREGVIAWIGHPMGMDEPLAQIVAGTYDPAAEADKQAQLEALGEKIDAAMQAGNVDEAVVLLDEVAALLPEAMRPQLALSRLMMYGHVDRWADGYPAIRTLVAETDDTETLNEIAWMLVAPDSPVAEPDLDLALNAALKCNELAAPPDPSFLDTLARVHFLKGDAALALKVQQQAVDQAVADDADADLIEMLKETLATYQSPGE